MPTSANLQCLHEPFFFVHNKEKKSSTNKKTNAAMAYFPFSFSVSTQVLTMRARVRAALLALVCVASACLHRHCTALTIRTEGSARTRLSRPPVSCSRKCSTQTPVPCRILYNINHLKLVSDEVPFLLSLGYEVYIPKHLPENAAEATSAGVEVSTSLNSWNVRKISPQYYVIPKKELTCEEK